MVKANRLPDTRSKCWGQPPTDMLNGAQDVREAVFEAGMDFFLSKPVRLDDLKNALTKFTAQTTLAVQLQQEDASR